MIPARKRAFLSLFPAFLLALASGPVAAQPAKTYNILFLLADDCTRFDLGCYGSRESRTPAIDGLAQSGMRFTRCQQASPMCSPTRHNLYTGMYPTRTGAYPNHTFARSNVLSVVQRLRPLGYRVAMSGKRHIAPASVFPFEYLDNDSGDGDGPGPAFPAVDAFLGQAAARKDRFCLFLTSHLPHSPWTKGNQAAFNPNTLTLPPHFVDNAETRLNYRNYLAEINALDGQLQSALDLLEKHGLADSTVVFFASEQGTSMPFSKWTCYNAGLGSAMIVRWPGVVAPGSVTDALIEYSDVVPTLIDIAGGAAVGGLDGFSFVPVLKGRANRHKDYSYGMMTTRGIFGGSEYFPIRSITDGKYRLIVNHAPDIAFHNNSEMPEWGQAADQDPVAAALVDRYRHRPAVELYHDAEDKWNMRNLAADPRYESVRQVLTARLSEWMRYAVDDPFQTELAAFDRMEKPAFNGDTVMVIQPPSPSSRLLNVAGGVRFAMYNGNWTDLPDFAALTPARTGTVRNLTGTAALPGRAGSRYAVRYSGFVRASVPGFHTFYLNSYNHARLSIDGKFIVATTLRPAANAPARRYGCIRLDSGWHAIEVSFLGNSIKDSLSVAWSYPGLIEAEGNLLIPDDALSNGDIAVPVGKEIPYSQGAAWMVRGNTLIVSPWLQGAEIRTHDAHGSLLRRSNLAGRGME